MSIFHFDLERSARLVGYYLEAADWLPLEVVGSNWLPRWHKGY